MKYKDVKIIETENGFCIKTNENSIEDFKTESEATDYVDLFSDNENDISNLIFFSNSFQK